MSVSQIPNLTPATALNGSEQLEAVQAGSTVKVTASQIAAYTQAQYPVSTITSVTATSPLSSTTVGNAVTISLPVASVTNTYLAAMPNNTLMGNFTGGSSQPVYSTVSTALDSIGSTQGGMLYRGASAWAQISAGSLGYVLTSAGSGGTPYWTNLNLGSMATQNANNVSITGGNISGVAITTSTINQTTIGATTPSTGAFTTLSASSTATFGTISSGVWQGTPVAVAYGGTGANNAASARTNLGAAKSGANADITSLTGLTTPLAETEGGTGYGSYTTGDLLYAASSTTLARLNDVATGNVLTSGGVGAAPSWGKVVLTSAVSGTLPVANGGTGATTLTGYLYGNGTGAFTASATIPNAGLTNSTVTIGSTSIALGATSATLAGLTTVTLTQDPTAALQASTKQYVDNQVATVSNQTFHAASGYATTANLTATYSNGTGGVGATLTNSGALAALTIDGYTFTATDVTNATRVLVKDQTSGLQNGIYTVTNQGSGAAAWVLTRAADFNTVGTGPNYIETGASTFVTSGSVNASTGWVMNTSGTITVGSTALTWAQTSSSSSVTVTSPLTKVGSVIGLGTVPTTLGGTGLTTLTAYSVMIGNGTGNVAFATPSTAGYPLLSTGASSNPSFGQLSLTAGVTGTLPVANGGTGTATAFTTGSVVFAGASGTYSQNNAKFFWDNTNNRLGINTAVPNANMTIVSNTQTTAVPSSGSLPAGTDLYIMGANAANTRITQDAYGSGNYSAYTGRQARGTAASPTASQTDDILVEVTGRGYGATGFSSSSVVRIDMEAAEAFTDTAQGTYISLHTSALGTASAVERFRIGPSGQFGIGGATYGTSGYVLTSGGASAAPTWSQVSATSLSGVLPVANGGTGLASWTTGSLVYASGTTTLAGLADVATGNVLLSGGVGVAPAWGQVSLTTAVTGTLPIANGGTGLATTPANGALDIGNGTGFTRTTLTQGTNIAITNGAGSISIATSATPSFATSVTTPLVIGGTAASSSLTLQSTSGVGTSDSILFKVGNNGATTAMTVDTNGNVGIGTNSLTSKLNVVGSFNAGTVGSYPVILGAGPYGGGIGFQDGAAVSGIYTQSTGTNLIFFTGQTSADAASSKVRMLIDGSGNVGIGQTSPGYKLDVGGGTGLQVIRVNGASSGTSAGSAVYMAQSGSTNIAIGNYSAIIGGAYDGTGYIYNTGGFAIKAGGGIGSNMCIDTSGRTMIGLAASKTYGNTLQVQGGIQNFGANSASISDIIAYDYNSVDASPTYAGAVLRKYGSTATGNLYVAAAVAAAGWAEISGINTSGLGIGTNGANPIVFGTTSTERMRITSAGIVGINTASPAGDFSLTMQNASGINAGFVALTGGGGTQVSATVYSDASYGYFGTRTAHSMQLITNGTNRVTIDSGGSVGIGFSSGVGTYGQLEVGGSTNPTMAIRSSSGSGTVFCFTAVGATEARINAITNVPMTFYTNNTLSMTLATGGNLTTVGSITDSIGNVRNVPQNAQTAAYVLVASDNGKHISITTGGVTVNSGIFSAGQSVTVYNNSASSQTITQGTSVTMYLVGTATTGNRTLAQRGLCTIFCVASNTFVITGGGLT